MYPDLGNSFQKINVPSISGAKPNINAQPMMYGFNRDNINPSPLGTIISNDFASGSWTNNGGTWTFPGTKIVTSGGADTLTQWISYTSYYVALDNCVFTAEVKLTDANPSATSDGFMIGFQAWNGGGGIGNEMIQVAPTAAKIRAWTYDTQISTISGQPAAPNFPAPVQNDVVRMRVTRIFNTTKFEVWNLTNGVDYATYSYTHTLTYPLGSYSTLPSTKICFWNVKGGFEVQNYSLTSTEFQNIDTLCVGDSKTAGKGLMTVVNRDSMIGNFSGIAQVSGCGGDETAQIVSRLTPIINYKPKQVILQIGCNDLADGVATATWQANYANIYNTLTAAGITVYHLLSTPDSRGSQSVLNNYISAGYKNVIDVYTPMVGQGTTLNPLYDCGDGIHLSPLGEYIKYQIIKSKYPNII